MSRTSRTGRVKPLHLTAAQSNGRNSIASDGRFTARMRKRKAKVKEQRRRGVSDPELHLKITVLNQQMGSNEIEQ